MACKLVSLAALTFCCCWTASKSFSPSRGAITSHTNWHTSFTLYFSPYHCNRPNFLTDTLVDHRLFCKVLHSQIKNNDGKIFICRLFRFAFRLTIFVILFDTLSGGPHLTGHARKHAVLWWPIISGKSSCCSLFRSPLQKERIDKHWRVANIHGCVYVC